VAPAAASKAGAASAGSGFSRKIGGVPLYAYAGAGVAVVGVIYYLRRKNAAAAAASQSTAGNAGTTGGTQMATTPGGYGGGGGGIGSDTLAAILASQGAGSTSSSTSTTYTPPTGETIANGSYYTPNSQVPVQDASGNRYVITSSLAQAKQLQAAGQALYIQPLPGIFTPTQTLTDKQPTYVMVPSNYGATAVGSSS